MNRLSGRVILFRVHGGISFGQIRTNGVDKQFSLHKDDFDKYVYKEICDSIGLGDFISISGEYWTTQKGVLTLRAAATETLRKVKRPIPAKFGGMVDVETKYRQRYLDLLTSAKARSKFTFRSDLIKSIRTFFWEKGFIEVETPTLQNQTAGASAKPFVTRHNALDSDFYLRISPETYLKRVVVGGFEQVFEIGKSFRNEGIDPSHLQEFTMLEWYSSYVDYKHNISLTIELIKRLCELANETGIELNNSFEFFLTDSEIPVIKFKDAFYSELGINLDEFNTYDKLINKVKNVLPESIIEKLGSSEVYYQLVDNIYKLTVRKQITTPVILIEQPSELCPLAQRNTTDPSVLDMFQLVVDGWEVVKGYTELTDPDVQYNALVEQQLMREQGDEEAMMLEEDFITAMEYGMPPMSGVGIGIDRLLALMLKQENLKDVILFPTLKPLLK